MVNEVLPSINQRFLNNSLTQKFKVDISSDTSSKLAMLLFMYKTTWTQVSRFFQAQNQAYLRAILDHNLSEMLPNKQKVLPSISITAIFTHIHS